MTEEDRQKEPCGRCAMSSVSGVMEQEHDPFEGERIEVAEDELRTLSPGILLGRVKNRVDGLVTKIIYGR